MMSAIVSFFIVTKTKMLDTTNKKNPVETLKYQGFGQIYLMKLEGVQPTNNFILAYELLVDNPIIYFFCRSTKKNKEKYRELSLQGFYKS